MDRRQQRGMEIVANNRSGIRRANAGWFVPSQSGSGKYAVTIGENPTCTCPDHELHGGKCKHIWAVEVIQTEFVFDGTTMVRRELRVTETIHRKTYPQAWPAYNTAQTTEKDRFQALLRELCAGIVDPASQKKAGRPRLPLSDMIFSAAFKVYSTLSGRRFMSDLREAQRRGYLSKVPHYNSIFNYLEDPDLTPLLRDLITQSSLPLKSVEADFAVDSSGFMTSRFVRWFDHRYGQQKEQHDWVKCHIMCDVKTNVVTAVEIHGRDTNDSPLLPSLVATTARHFAMAEVSADKGYASKANSEAITQTGAVPYIAFRRDHTGTGGGAWAKMFGYFTYRRDDFLAHYHKRSNVEATFSMIKRKFGDALRSKSDTAMVNETLCKLLCHNLVVLIHEIHELGIAPVFWANNSDAQKDAVS
jgi:transposase